jgi:F-type H+-transporting ATPase subunit delta
MSDMTQVARPYARAAFDLAQAQDTLQAWDDELELLAAIASDSQMHSLLSNPRLPRPDRAQLVLDVAGDKVGAEAANLVRLLAENGRLPALPAVFDAFSAMKAEAEKRVHADVVAFRKLTQAQEKEIHDALAKGLGCEVELECSVDRAPCSGGSWSVPATW